MWEAPNVVAIPLDRLEEMLLSFARPKVYGQIVVAIELQEEVRHALRLRAEYRQTTVPDVTKDESHVVASNERYNLVRHCLAEKAGILRVVCPVSKIVASYRDGKLTTFEVITTDEAAIAPTI
jgi:hypothetical protein